MLVRLLLVVLMTAGPIPVRLCTCAAAGGSDPRPAPPPAAAPAKSCGCKNHEVAESAPPAGDALKTRAACAEQPVRHDRDCPAVNPRPAITAAAVTPAGDLAADSGPAPAARSDAPAIMRPISVASPDPGPPSLPLYLSLRSLRI